MRGQHDGQYLRRLIATLGVPYGLEKSCKISREGISRDRVLLTLSKVDFGGDPSARLAETLRALEIPPRLLPICLEAASDATLVHFGHEGSSVGSVSKVYFEYAAPSTQTPPEPWLVYRAFKWRPDSDAADETHYVRLPIDNPDDLEDLICGRLGLDTVFAACVASLQSCLTVRWTAKDFMLLDVVDRTSERKSLDLNLYPAAIAIGQVPPLFDIFTARFGLQADVVDRLFAALAGQTLGHVAGGFDRQGREFVTLYHGLEAR